MAIYPNYYAPQREDIKSPQFIGEYNIPLINASDYDQVLTQSHKQRYDKINAKNNAASGVLKNVNNLSTNNKNVFSSPIVQDKYIQLQESHGINDAAYSAILNGDPYMMRKLESGYYKMSNSKDYWDLQREELAFKEFKKNAYKISDPNMRQQAFASISAYEMGEDDPVLGRKMNGLEFNPGDYAVVDLEKDFDKGLGQLMVPQERVVEQNGVFTTIKDIALDKEAAKTWTSTYLQSPAVQRTLASRGYGLNEVVDGKQEFHLNEQGQVWMKNILDSKTTTREDIQNIKFGSKAYLDRGSHSGGFITDDIANASIEKEDFIKNEGGQSIRGTRNKFDENIFYNNTALKLRDPVFKATMIKQGFLNEDGSYTDALKTKVEDYKKQINKDDYKASKNLPSGTNSKGVKLTPEQKAWNTMNGSLGALGFKLKRWPKSLGLRMSNVNHVFAMRGGKLMYEMHYAPNGNSQWVEFPMSDVERISGKSADIAGPPAPPSAQKPSSGQAKSTQKLKSKWLN